MVGFDQRVKSFFRGARLTSDRQMDHYLTEHLPRLAREYELATVEQMRPIDLQIEGHRASVTDLEGWKATSSGRVEQIKKRLSKLEVRYGLGGR